MVTGGGGEGKALWGVEVLDTYLGERGRGLEKGLKPVEEIYSIVLIKYSRNFKLSKEL